MSAREVQRRVLLECRPSIENAGITGKVPDGVGKGGCGKEWFNVTEKISAPDYWGRSTRTLQLPNRCPKCSGWNLRLLAQLQVSESRTEKLHTCENTCQWSESKKCKCACGGKMHGAMLKMECAS